MIQTEKIAQTCEDGRCAPPALVLTTKPKVDRTQLIRQVFRLEWLTIGWMIIEAVVALASGIAAGSLVLVAFGLDSVIELIFGRCAGLAPGDRTSPWPGVFRECGTYR